MRKSQSDPRAAIPDEYKPAEWLIKSPHRLKNADAGISHRDIIHAGVGVALSAWELLETLLAWNFQHLIGTDKISALRAWGSIASSKARVSAIMAAANEALQGDELAHHRRCMEDVNFLSGARNLVAHGMVYYLDDENGWTSIDARSPHNHEVPHALGPAYYNTNKMRDGSFYLFSNTEIQLIVAEIHKMQSRVAALSSGEYHRFFRVSMK